MTSPFIMEKDLTGITYFEADTPGIVTLKAQFADEAEEFLWLRKGEDVGADIIATFLALVNTLGNLNLMELVTAYALFHAVKEGMKNDYKAIWKLWERAQKLFKENPFSGRKPKDLRILCWPDEDNEEARPLYEVQGYSVRHYRDERLRGSHRFYLNDERYCLFFRTPDERFFGFIGKDTEVMSQLRTHFEYEWDNAVVPKS